EANPVPTIKTAPAPPYLIGIAGPSCAGKTELATHLAADLSAAVLPLDCYYLDLSSHPLEERARFNFDEPRALDHKLFLQHLQALAAGNVIERPVYDFSIHTRTGKTESVRPGRFLIVEGLFVLHWEDVRALFGTRVFVDLPDGPCLERRIVRDVRERGRAPESVRLQFAETVQPMAALYVRPTRIFADLVIGGDQPIRESVDAVMAHIRRES
ncbi:MAG: uridine kinase, partial [Acidobacteriota bacterium]